MSANETQVGGTHYTDMPIQPWDFMQSCMSAEQFAGYLLGNVIKYAARHQAKGGIEDLRKCAHYLNKLIEAKEVMSVEGHSGPQPAATTPAVSESAAGDWPGPDWSQAPEWANWWAKDLNNKRGGCWFEKEPQMNKELEEPRANTLLFGGYWSLGKQGSRYKWSGDQGYTGHWRDSLRKRPSVEATAP